MKIIQVLFRFTPIEKNKHIFLEYSQYIEGYFFDFSLYLFAVFYYLLEL